MRLLGSQLFPPSALSLALFILAFALAISGIAVILFAGPVFEDGGRTRSTGVVLIALGVLAAMGALLGHSLFNSLIGA